MKTSPAKLKHLLKRTAVEKEVFQNHMLDCAKDYATDPESLKESMALCNSDPEMIAAIKTLQEENLEELPEISTPQIEEIKSLLSAVIEQDATKAENIITLLTSELEYRRREKPLLNWTKEHPQPDGTEPCP